MEIHNPISVVMKCKITTKMEFAGPEPRLEIASGVTITCNRSFSCVPRRGDFVDSFEVQHVNFRAETHDRLSPEIWIKHHSREEIGGHESANRRECKSEDEVRSVAAEFIAAGWVVELATFPFADMLGGMKFEPVDPDGIEYVERPGPMEWDGESGVWTSRHTDGRYIFVKWNPHGILMIAKSLSTVYGHGPNAILGHIAVDGFNALGPSTEEMIELTSDYVKWKPPLMELSEGDR